MGNHGESWGIMNRNFIIQIDKLLRYLANYLAKFRFLHALSAILTIKLQMVGQIYCSGMIIMDALAI